jgi:hypothetical protein
MRLVFAVDRADELCRVVERRVRRVDLSHAEDRGDRLFERQQVAQLLLDQVADHPVGLRPQDVERIGRHLVEGGRLQR